MGCGASKGTIDTVEGTTPMKEVSKDQTQQTLPVKSAATASQLLLQKKNSIAFEVPVDDLKVVSAQPTNAVNGSKKSLDKLDIQDTEALKQRLKEKDEQVKKNRLKELENMQEKAKKRAEQMQQAAERRAKLGEESGAAPVIETAA